LAYIDQGRLKVLNPIRQYIKGVHPPPHEAVKCLCRERNDEEPIAHSSPRRAGCGFFMYTRRFS
jgi:hypothetical protein